MINEISVLLLDIEGTTTSIKFVKETLFPYVRQHLSTYLWQNWGSATVQADVDALKQLANDQCTLDSSIESAEQHAEKEQSIGAIVNNVNRWMDGDKKFSALKTLQGNMWRNAYEECELTGHVFEDVSPVLTELVERGLKVYIYSSGSVQAQRLLFAHSTAGDLSHLISGYFDTNIGAKVEADSYRKIAADIQVDPATILFLTDIEKEADAARLAGCRASLVCRPGNANIADGAKRTYKTIHTFDSLLSNDLYYRCTQATPGYSCC